MFHEFKELGALRKAAQAGLYEEGVSLKLSGELQSIGENAIGGEYTGHVNGEDTKAYVIVLINPYGNGVTIIATTSLEKYTTYYKDLSIELARSVQFTKPLEPEWVADIRRLFSNGFLEHLDAGSSSDVNLGFSASYSRIESIKLCKRRVLYFRGRL